MEELTTGHLLSVEAVKCIKETPFALGEIATLNDTFKEKSIPQLD